MSEKFKIAIVGGGPAGLSAAAHASELGVSHILLESAPHLANTIHRCQRGKPIMAEPARLPLRSAIFFEASIREALLQRWNEEAEAKKVNFKVDAAVSEISGQRGDFKIVLANNEQIFAEYVILAIGVQGNIHKLNIEGDHLPSVQYHLDDASAYINETIVVVGAGDAGVENALALAEQNRVILINRHEKFDRCKDANVESVMAAIKAGKIELRENTSAVKISQEAAGLPLLFVSQSPKGREKIGCHRVIARLGASPPRKLVESFGVQFPNNDANATPQLSDQYESNVSGLYVIGTLAGYPLIKQAMNQGYEVVEYILGNVIEPADQPLLQKKFVDTPAFSSVSESIALIRQRIPLWASMSSLQLRELILDSQITCPEPDEIIFKLNDYSNSFYSILQGAVTVEAETQDGGTTAFQLKVGDFFGEMSLVSGRRRTATVMAAKGCVLIETPRRTMLKLISTLEDIHKKLDEVALKRVLQSYLAIGLNDAEIEELVSSAQNKHYATGEVLFQEGDKADGLYMIQRGSVMISRNIDGKEVVLDYISAGNYVGEMALVSDSTRSATVKAASPTEVVILSAERAKALLDQNVDVRATVGSRYMNQVRTAEAHQNTEFSGLMQFLMKQGVGEATDVLLIDYSRCIRCNNCETSCANLHDGVSRLNREAGPTYEDIHVPGSCRHCEHPHCMKDCPPDAIHRSVNGEVFINDSCIGCGNCERNCPYSVIQMAVVKAHKPPGLWEALFGKWASVVESASEDPNANKKAVKCDMCKDMVGGPACVRFCPTGAAIRVGPEEFLNFVKNA
ncbi:MAG: cyclic nucleotide-binding domain-containing protein [Gallionellaceae bacterium]